MKNYGAYVREQIVNTISAEKTGREWRKGDGGRKHICLEIRDNFIDQKFPDLCCIKGDLFKEPIGYHIYSHSLNSSQVMCISFFKKFFENDENQKILLSTLKTCGLLIPSDMTISNAIFEYVPDKKENTNFDFYMILSNGQNISFEIKYTEAEFGGMNKRKNDNPNKYGDKWEVSYKNLVEKCPYLENPEECVNGYMCIQNAKLDSSSCEKVKMCQIYRFYSHYQINRNISWAKKDTDIVVFLTPRENEDLNSGRDYIDRFENPNIKNLYWEDLVDVVLKLTENKQELKKYYINFKKKYIDFKETEDKQ